MGDTPTWCHTMAATHRHKELFERVVDALNDRDREAFAETHHADVVLHDHDEVFHGVEAAIKHEWDIYEAFPDMEYVPEAIIAEGDTVAARWRVKGTHEGELDGIHRRENPSISRRVGCSGSRMVPSQKSG